MYQSELDELEEQITLEITNALLRLSNDRQSKVSTDIQPPESVVRLSAKAAVQVMLAFELGYQWCAES